MTIADGIRPRQLRLIIEAADFDDAVRFFRDVLGMPEQPAFATEGDDRVSILHAGIATIEIASPAHIGEIDRVEGAPDAGPEAEGGTPTLRIALEVADTAAAVDASTAAGLTVIAPPPIRTPFQTLNARVAGPAGWQVTFFQELETLEQRAQREGFTTDDERPR